MASIQRRYKNDSARDGEVAPAADGAESGVMPPGRRARVVEVVDDAFPKLVDDLQRHAAPALLGCARRSARERRAVSIQRGGSAPRAVNQ
jgi:hypothetical protein